MSGKPRRIAGGLVAVVVLALVTLTAQAPTGPGQSPVVSSGGGGVSFVSNSGVASGPFLAPDGTAAAPSYSFASEPGVGIYHVTGAVRVGINGTLAMNFGSASIGISNDAFLSRTAAGVIAVGTSQGSTAGTLAATTVALTATTFAALGTPANGVIVFCSDCLKGSTPCTGASTGTLAIRQAGAWACF